MQYTVEQIKNILKADGRVTTPDSRVTRLLTDSRSLSFPEETMFFAIKTRHGDGHRYIGELYRRGVRDFVVTQADGIKELKDLLWEALQKDIEEQTPAEVIFPELPEMDYICGNDEDENSEEDNE